MHQTRLGSCLRRRVGHIFKTRMGLMMVVILGVMFIVNITILTDQQGSLGFCQTRPKLRLHHRSLVQCARRELRPIS